MASEQSTVRYERFRFAGGVVVDVARFALARGKEEAQLVEASARMQAEFEAEGGFLGRLLTQDERGIYLDILYWTRPPEALPGMESRILASTACAAFTACMAEPKEALPPVNALIRGLVATSSAAGTTGLSSKSGSR